jgi:Sigma-70, region 4
VGTEQRDLLWLVLNELGEEDRLAISYRYLFDLSQEELGEALGWPEAMVGARLARALGRYRLRLDGRARPRSAGRAAARLARVVAAWDEDQLEQALADLGEHLPLVPTSDLSGAVVRRLHHRAPRRRRTG